MIRKRLYAFGPFRVDPAERLLWRDDKPVSITSKSFDVLVILLERAGHLVTKADLMKAVWPNCFVEDGSLAVTVSMLRKALGDEDHACITTVSKQGYRFVSEVRETVKPEPEDELPLPPPPQKSSAPMMESSTEAPPIRRSSFRHSALFLLVAFSGVLVAGLVLLSHLRALASRPPVHSLLVLPFRSSKLDPARDYLCVGIAEDLTSNLAATGQLAVRPTTGLESAKSTTEATAIGRAQKVDAVVFGDIEVSADRIRVDAKLVRVADSSVIWTRHFESAQARVLDLEHEMEDTIAQAIPIHVSPQEIVRSPATMTINPAAFRLYLEGRYFWNKRTEQGLRRSIESFQQATLEDQYFAAAYAGLADSYALLASYGVEPAQQAYPTAKAAALKALQIDDGLSEAHTSLAMICFYYEWNWRQAEREFRRSIELNPNYALAHTWYALELAALGRSDEASSQIQAAYQLDPLSMSTNTEVGRVFYWNRQYDQAIEVFKKVIDLDSHFARVHTRLGMAYAAKNDYSAALREFEVARGLSGPDPYLDGLRGYAAALSGNTTMARNILAELADRASRDFVPAFSIALVSLGLGDRNRALDWLSRSYQDRSTYMVYVNVDPLLDPLRSDRRFTELVDRMGLVSRNRESAGPIR